ncbi:MAG: hypothetical protein K2R93_17695 [Gemmatimonadaceae bacterium]|nr:hypothetical protein [Gemmatimonadaceae bacterium]
MRAVSPRAARLAVAALGLAACSETTDPRALAPESLQPALKARTIYPAKREEWRSDITSDVDSTMVPLVFRASGTTVALLQANPTRISQFELHGHGMLLSARPGRVDSVLNAQVPRDLVAPVELSRATEDGHVDVIDSASSILMRESLGGFVFRRDLPLLRGGSYRLCTVTPATLLHVRALGENRALEAYTLTAIAAEDSLIGRHRIVGETAARLRFGGGDNRHCLLLTSREVLIVSAPDSARAGAPPRIQRLRRPGDGAAPRQIGEPPALAGSAVEHPFIVDASIVDGGYVVLVGLENDRQGRVIDYYNAKGEYLQSAMLPFTASAMAGSGPRFLVLHQDAKYKWWLSSWLTPMAARGATAPPDPPSVTRAPEKQLFEPARRSATP